jgi:phosphoserine aminotransferase
MFNLFKCKHPFKSLIVEKNHTIKQVDEDFNHINYYLMCSNCDTKLTLGWASLVGGVDAYIERGRKKYQ